MPNTNPPETFTPNPEDQPVKPTLGELSELDEDAFQLQTDIEKLLKDSYPRKRQDLVRAAQNSVNVEDFMDELRTFSNAGSSIEYKMDSLVMDLEEANARGNGNLSRELASARQQRLKFRMDYLTMLDLYGTGYQQTAERERIAVRREYEKVKRAVDKGTINTENYAKEILLFRQHAIRLEEAQSSVVQVYEDLDRELERKEDVKSPLRKDIKRERKELFRVAKQRALVLDSIIVRSADVSRLVEKVKRTPETEAKARLVTKCAKAIDTLEEHLLELTERFSEKYGVRDAFAEEIEDVNVWRAELRIEQSE